MSSRRLRWLVAVAVIAVLALAATARLDAPFSGWIARQRTQFAIERLLEHASPADLPAARFSAIPSARLRSSMRGRAAPAAQIDVDAAKLLALSIDSDSPDAVAATAVAWAIRGDLHRAAQHLEAAVAHDPRDARLWSDLSATYYEMDRPLRALVAVDTALRIDAQLDVALTNRSLILERMGLPSVADENHPSERTRWKAAEPTLLAAAAGGDATRVEQIVVESPGLARAYAEGVYLARWADAVQADPAKAGEWLRASRMIGAVLRSRGESLAADAVAAIDAASARRDSVRLAALVRAHLAYDRGRRAYARENYRTTLRELGDAAQAFAEGRSPMASVARTYIAGTLIRSSRLDDASAALRDVVATAEQHPAHRALLANAQYHLALCETFRGHWDRAVEVASGAATLFRQIGESENAADCDNQLASIFDLVGQRERSWEIRLRGFAETSAGGAADRLLVAIGAATRAAVRARDLDLALSLLDLEVVLASRVRSPLLTADLFKRRALLQHERGDFPDRDASLFRARAALGAIANAGEREQVEAEVGAAEAAIVRRENPQRAIELLDRAIGQCEISQQRLLLPNYRLQRGRALLAANNPRRASQDFEAGIDEIDAQRSSTRDVRLRMNLFDTAAELLEAALRVRVAEGDAEEAFRIAEQARARSLLDLLPGEPRPLTSSAEIARRLARGTLLVEYAVLPDELVIFTVRPDGLQMHRVAIARADLERNPALPSILLDPIAADLDVAERVIFIPDGVLQRVAFAGLRRGGRYLTESHTIAESPSASRLVVQSVQSLPKSGGVLIVGNPAADPAQNLDALPRVRKEVASLRAIHPGARVLLDEDATKSRFLAEAARYDVIHFGGHGMSDDRSATASLLFYDDAHQLTPLTASEIGQLRFDRAPLVVLSACGTLRGRIDGVDGMPSIARAFLAAGASAVVGTLTDVNDALAADLMTSFHRRIAAGVLPAEALRAAQQEAIARGGAAGDRKNWAQFVLYSATP